MTARRGFTLLEALAAVVTLGLLAAAVVPLLRDLGRLGLADRLQAQAWLRTLRAQDPLVATIPGHPDWSLSVSELIAEAEPAPPTGCPPPAGPAHRWLLVSVRAAGNGESLAETVVAVVDQGSQP